MANDVFANGREVSCKAADGKSICAFPDVCLSPPSPPAGPIPVPYPNTGMASDTTDGSKSVLISGKEAMLKDKSYFKKSTGDEAATKSLGMGVVTHQIQGKVYFTSWSMDVMFEGENVVRHLDLTTHNHNPPPGNSPPWVYADKMAVDMSDGQVCRDQEKAAEDECTDATPHMEPTKSGGTRQKGLDCSDDCRAAKACVLKPKSADKAFCCHPETTGHHLVEVNCFTHESGRSPPGLPKGLEGVAVEYAEGSKRPERLPGFDKYDDEAAPCTCASESVGANSHGVMHAVQSKMRDAWAHRRAAEPLPASFDSFWTYAEARDAGARAHKIANPHCNEECTRRALDEYHVDKAGIDPDEPVRSCMDWEPSTKGVTPEQAGQVRKTVAAILNGAAG